MIVALAALAGVALGFVGTLVGAGGGFLIVPALTLLAPSWTPETITAYSLAVVTANATAGSASYLRQRRVDVTSALQFSAAAVPGAIAGAYVDRFVPRRTFDLVFGAALVLLSIWLFMRPETTRSRVTSRGIVHELVDASGERYTWSYNPALGIAGAVGVGFFSSFLGIGGGVIHVPFMATVLGFPGHIATATSHAVLAITALVATVVHVLHGDYRDDWPLVTATAAGAVAGAPMGAALSRRLSGRVLLRILAVALFLVGLRLLFS